MERKKVINTFGGLDTDTSFNKYTPERYFSCENFRSLLNEENGSHALVNVKGNKTTIKFTLRSGDPARIQGIGEFDDSVVIFIESEREDSSVYHIPKEDLERDEALTIDVNSASSPYRILKDKRFNLSDTLRIICRKETSDIYKVYFTDGTQPLRFFNVKDPDIDDVDINKFNIVPDVKFNILTPSLTSGSLKAGKVGYSYQLYNIYGSESNYSPVTHLTSLFRSSVSNPRLIRGDEVGTVTNKGIKLSGSDIDERFDRIRIVRILYEDFNLEPSIEVIHETSFEQGSFTFTDIGLPGIDTFTVEEFNQLLLDPIPKTLDSKNNYLFIANAKEGSFDVEYDAKNNVTYEQITTPTIIDLNIIGTPLFEPQNYTDKQKLGFQRGELYRVGVVLFDKKMRPSFVKHIADIEIDDVDEIPIAEQKGGSLNLVANNIQLEFTLSNLPEEVEYYQIVRVPRTKERRSVLDVGYLGVLRDALGADVGNYDLEFGSHNSTIFETQFGEYASPEVTYNKLEETGEVLQVISKLNLAFNTDIVGGDSDLRIKKYYPSGSNSPIKNKSIDKGTYFAYSGDLDASSSIDNKKVRHVIRKTSSDSLGNNASDSMQQFRGFKNSCMLLKIPNYIEAGFAPEPTDAALCRRRKNFSNGHPLNFYGSTDTSEFIPCSEVKSRNTKNITAWGDTYINMFEYFRGSFHSGTDRYAECMIFPVETSIDLQLIGNPTFNTLFSTISAESITNSDEPFRWMREVAGEYGRRDSDDNIDVEFVQDFNWYTYNSAYSRTHNIRTYFTKPKDVKFESTFSNRIYYSDKKTNGEFSDSWAKFRPNNNMDLDARYGEITRIYNFRDTLFALQREAVAAIPVEQRELVQTNTPGPLVAGIGDAVSNPHYLSTESGLMDYEAVTNSRNAVYYYDRRNNKLCRLAENVQFISDELNVSSLLTKYKNNINFPVLAYDRNYNEVLFKLVNNSTLAYNEYKNLFTGVYTYRFDREIQSGNTLFIIDGGNIIQVGAGDYGNFIRGYSDSTIKIIVNPAGNQNVLYDILELTHEIYKDGQLLANEAVESIRIYNEYQDTGELDLNQFEGASQRFRTWRINTLVDKDPDESRIRSSSIFVEIRFRNQENKKIVLHDIITNIRPTKLR